MIYVFEEWQLDTIRRELRRGDEIALVEPQVFDVLEVLMRENRRLVTRDDLTAEVWGGRIVSDSTISSRISAARKAIGDDGKTQRLIQTLSRRGYRFVGKLEIIREPGLACKQPSDVTGDASGQKFSGAPSIAILPFAGPSEAEEMQKDLFFGLTEDITTALSRYSWLSVAARSASCNYSGWAIDVRRVGRDLGVHYVLEGSIRPWERGLRVTSRLVDAIDAKQLWAESVDLARDDIFLLQDQIATNLVNAIEAKIEQIEIACAGRAASEAVTAAQCYFRGLGYLYTWTREGVDDALDMFRRTTRIDPYFAPAYGMAAYCHVQRKSYGWTVDRDQASEECERFSLLASELGGSDAIALAKAAHAIASVAGDLDGGAVLSDRAIKANPKLDTAWYVSAWVQLFLGRPENAMDRLAQAMRLGAHDPLAFKIRAALAYAHFFGRRYDDAAAAAHDALRERPGYLTAMRAAAASHAMAGRVELARDLIRRMHERDPALCMSNLPDLIPFRREEDFARWADGLQIAGLPD